MRYLLRIPAPYIIYRYLLAGFWTFFKGFVIIVGLKARHCAERAISSSLRLPVGLWHYVYRACTVKLT